MTTTVHGRPAAPVLGALLLAALSFALSQTMVAPALPAIAEGYGTTASAASWVLSGYLLSASVCTPLAGKLGDLYGKGRVLTIVLVIFSVGSVVCALAESIELVIAGRVIQGVAGGVFPLAFGIVNDELDASHRAKAIGIISAMFGIGGGIGLPLSGVIVDNADLSFLFWIGLMALPAAYVTWTYVPPSPARERTGVDWRGAAVLSVGLVAVLFGISRTNTWGWGSPRVLALIAGGVVVLAAFVALEKRTKDPLIDIRVLGDRPVLTTNIAAFLVGMAMFGSFLLVPAFVQAPESSGYGFGMSVTEAGLVMLPSSFVMLLAGPLGGTLGSRIGFRAVLTIGTVAVGLSFLLLALAHGGVFEFLLSSVLVGVGISFAFAAMANLVVASVPPRDVGIATGINTVARTVGGAFGAALVTVLLTTETLPTGLPTETAYVEAFAISAVLAVIAAGAALAIPRLRGERSAEPVAA